jgi:hypothetical protein
VIRVLHVTGINLADSALLISWLAILGTLFLVWYGWGRELPPARAFVMLALFGLFPGAVYNFALFPTSLALMGVVGALLAAVRERFLLAAVLMTLAGLCYPSAWFAATGLAVGMVLVSLRLGRSILLRRAAWGAAGLASLAILLINDGFAFGGHATAYFLADSQSGLVAKGFPGEDFLRLLFTRSTAQQRLLGRFAGVVLAVQGALAVGLSGWTTLLVAAKWRRGSRDPSEIYPALAGLVVTLVILFHTTTGGAWNRSIVLAAPCVVCLRRLPMPLMIPLLLLVGTTTMLISRSFFTGTLV